MDVDRDEFYRRMQDLYNNKKAPNSMLLSREKYNMFINKYKAAKVAEKKSPADYQRLRKYLVTDTPEGERIFTAPTSNEKRRQMLVRLDEMYDIIRHCHLKLKHGGRSRMMIELKHKYKNVTAESVLIYLSMCTPCKGKIKRSRLTTDDCTLSKNSDNNEAVESTGSDVQVPTHFAECSDVSLQIEPTSRREKSGSLYRYPELYSRGQADILCVSKDDGDEYKYLMVYRNFITKYINLKPMKALSLDEAADTVLDVFLTFGAPNILQSKNGIDVIKPICRKITNLFPDIKVLASEKNFTNDDFEGNSNEDILKMLNEWLAESRNTKWQEGIKFVQFKLNSMFNEVLCRTPSEIVFGQKPSQGVTSFMPKNVYEDLITEQDLITVFENAEREKAEPSVPKQLQFEESLILPENFFKMEAEDIDVTEEVLEDAEI